MSYDISSKIFIAVKLETIFMVSGVARVETTYSENTWI